MRALALASVLALTVAACGDKNAVPEPGAGEAVEAAGELEWNDQNLPVFRGGLWEVSGGVAGEEDVHQECIAEGVEPSIRTALTDESEGCTKNLQRVGGGLKMTGVCLNNGVRTDVAMTVKGSPTAYTMVLDMKVANEKDGSDPVTHTMKVAAKRVGPCPAGVEPGQRIGEEE